MGSQQGGSSPNGSEGLLLAVRQLDDMEAAQAEEWLEAEWCSQNISYLSA